MSEVVEAQLSAPSWRESVEPAARVAAAATAVGLLSGLLIGGVGGRLAMRALFLTTGPEVRGLVSDDGFVIGRFDLGATMFLLAVGAGAGVVGGFVYLAVRPFLFGPEPFRHAVCATAAGCVVGAMIVHADGVDFTLLGPRWFAVVLFIAIPALFGMVTPPAIERAARPDGWFRTAPLHLALLPLAVLLAPPALAFLAAPAAVVVGAGHLARRSSRLRSVVAHPAALWAGRAVWAAVALAGAVALVRDVRAVL